MSIDNEALMTNAGVLAIQKNVVATQAKPCVNLLPQNHIDSTLFAFSGEIMALMTFPLFVD